jgi:hypothetical protein
MNKSIKGAPKIKRTTPSSPILHAVPDLPAPKAIPTTTIGLDLGDQHCYFCVLDQDGNMLRECDEQHD